MEPQHTRPLYSWFVFLNQQIGIVIAMEPVVLSPRISNNPASSAASLPEIIPANSSNSAGSSDVSYNLPCNWPIDGHDLLKMCEDANQNIWSFLPCIFLNHFNVTRMLWKFTELDLNNFKLLIIQTLYHNFLTEWVTNAQAEEIGEEEGQEEKYSTGRHMDVSRL